MAYTPEQLEAYRQDVFDDNIDNGHTAIIFLHALDVIKQQERLLPHLVDVVWGEAHEDESVPSSEWAWRMIDRAKTTLSVTEVTTRDDVLIQIQEERARWAERLAESQAEVERLRRHEECELGSDCPCYGSGYSNGCSDDRSDLYA